VGQTLRINIPDGTTQGGWQLGYDHPIWAHVPSSRRYRISFEYTLVGGVAEGAGILFRWQTADGAQQAEAQATLRDCSQGPVTTGKVISASFIAEAPDSYPLGAAQKTNSLWLMGHYSGFGETPTGGKTIEFHRISITAVTDEEIGRGAVEAYIRQNFYSYADEGGAFAQALTELKAEIEAPNGSSLGATLVQDYVTTTDMDTAISAVRETLTVSAGNIVITSDGTGDDVGGWSNGNLHASVPTYASSYASAKAIRVADGASEEPPRKSTIKGRKFKVSAWIRVTNGTQQDFTFCVRGGQLPTDNGVISSRNWRTASGSWAFFEDVITVSSEYAYWKPAFDLVDQGYEIAFFGLKWVDVTSAEEVSGTLGGRIDGVKGLEANELTGTAFGTLLDQLEVDANGTSAKVTQFADAKADLDGFAAAFAGIVAETSGGNIAGLKLTAFDDPDGSGSSLVQLIGEQVVVPGSLTVRQLNVGSTSNAVPNSDFMRGTEDWTMGGSGSGYSHSVMRLRGPDTSFAGKDFPVLEVFQSTSGQDGYADVIPLRRGQDGQNTSRIMGIEPGKWYGVAAKMSLHRCTGAMYLFWYGAGDTVISITQLTGLSGSFSSENPNEWPTYWRHGQAPAGAQSLRVQFRKFATNAGSSDSYMMIHQPMTFVSHEDATEPPPYMPGAATTIGPNGIRTAAVETEKINGRAITQPFTDSTGSIITSYTDMSKWGTFFTTDFEVVNDDSEIHYGVTVTQVSSDNPKPSWGLRARILDLDNGQAQVSVRSVGDGVWQPVVFMDKFDPLPAGNYRIEVAGQTGGSAYAQNVHLWVMEYKR
jgi:hypothetical protein